MVDDRFMRKSITVIIVALIVGLTVVASVYLWSTNNRYYMITNKHGAVYGYLTKLPDIDERIESKANKRISNNTEKPAITQEEVDRIFGIE